MTSSTGDRSAEIVIKVRIVNIAYAKVAEAMNWALSDGLQVTQERFKKFQEAGQEFKFGDFANFMFKEDGKYDEPEDGYPSDEKTWKSDAGRFSKTDAARIVEWVSERLTGKNTHPLRFEVSGHYGDTVALFSKEQPADRILIFCPLGPQHQP